MAFERISENLTQLNENIKSFAESSAEYYKLDLFSKTMKGATAGIKFTAIAFFLLFFILFLSIAASVLISTWIGVPSSGFFIVAGFYLLLVLFLVFFGTSIITKMLLPATSKKVFNKPENAVTKEPEFTTKARIQEEEIIIEDERV
ncbi:MAG: phage holin family protein [Salinimicrobium sp.]